MSSIGHVHSFQTMGAVDGPGLRFVVFLQGCPLRCVYCHNPDTWEFYSGRPYAPADVVRKILRYRPYLKKGGVTVSGGEPLMQPDFVTELFRLLHREGIHTALDTSGAGNLADAERVLKHTDLVLADVKFLSVEEYRTHCKGDFKQVVRFLQLTDRMEIPLWIRQVIVPGLNDTENNIQKLTEFLEDFSHVQRVELLPFRKLCMEKYKNLHIPFPLADTPEMDLAKLERLQALLPASYSPDFSSH
ncbi:MAG: pyruvate formate-lyase-activating protein [Eubacteriales bacterium]|jgi:pyruvate formate lyase activating enzyme